MYYSSLVESERARCTLGEVAPQLITHRPGQGYTYCCQASSLARDFEGLPKKTSFLTGRPPPDTEPAYVYMCAGPSSKLNRPQSDGGVCHCPLAWPMGHLPLPS